MSTVIEKALARIYGPYGDPVGVGFAIGPGKLLTCAHVVCSALELPSNYPEKPEGELQLDFPFIQEDDPLPYHGHVISWDAVRDLALLEILGAPPTKLHPVKWAASSVNVWEHKIRSFGFPLNNEHGVWATGTLLAKNAIGWIEIVGTGNDNGYFVQPGFSGAPVWDESLQGIVGLVLAADITKGIKVAYALPVEVLTDFCGLHVAQRSSRRRPPLRKLNVFICYAKPDYPVAAEIYQKLSATGWIDPWLDEEKLLPGQDWRIEIEKAVEAADAVLVCLSKISISKEGYVQRELRMILDLADERPEGVIYTLPLRLDDCEVPRSLRSIQYMDYFHPERREIVFNRLKTALKARLEQKFGIND